MTTGEAGFEPATQRLTVVCTTAVLLANEVRRGSYDHHKTVCMRSFSQHEEQGSSVSLSDNVRGFSSVFY